MEEALIKRVLPHSLEAEQSVIGSMLMDREAVIAASEIVTGSDFYQQQYGIMFDAMVELFNEGKPVDLVTLQDRLKEKDVPPEVSSLDFVRDIVTMVPTSANVRSYATIVGEKAVLRRLIKTTEEIANTCYAGKEPLENILADTEKSVFNLLQNRGGQDFVPIKQVAINVLEKIEDAYKNQGTVTGIPSGFIDLDYKLSGFQPSDFILIAARPSMGKTAFVLNVVDYVAVRKSLPCMVFSLEMSKCRTMATTHYSELKVFALSTPGVENACCEFNVETLQPTYRLLIGIPGKSNAFAISQKLGLPGYIIDDAKSHLEAKDESFEDLLTSLESSRLTIEKEQAEINAYKDEIASLKNRLTQKEERLDERKDKILKNATEEAQRILREAKETADQTIKQINKLAASSGVGKELEAERARLRDQLKKTDEKLTVKPKGPSQPISPKKLKIGDGVKVLSMNLKGTVSTLPNARGDLYVQMGILRSLVNIRDLELLNEKDISATLGDGSSISYGGKTARGKGSGSSQIKMSKSSTVSAEVNLIGMTVDEAVPAMEKYLDDAYLAHLQTVRVVHGRGTGALKNAVHKRLRQLKYVKEFRLGQFGEGDSGVTVVTFK